MVLLLCIFFSLSYRLQGDGKRLFGLVIMSTCMYALGVYGLVQHYTLPLLVYPALVVFPVLGSIALRRTDPWGELFPHGRADKEEDFGFMKPLIDKLVGYKYSSELSADKLIHWRSSGWIVRHGIYGQVLAIWLAVCFQTIAPILIVPFMGCVVGWIYKRNFTLNLPDPLHHSELESGFVCALLFAATTLL